jgi:hypothetical protein
MDVVTLLNSSPKKYKSETSSGTNSAQAKLDFGPYATDAVVFITASGSASYKGPKANAGITVAIRSSITKGDLAVDDSFEGSSANITFRASASHMLLLKKGEEVKIEGATTHYGSGSQLITGAKISLTCFALAVRL